MRHSNLEENGFSLRPEAGFSAGTQRDVLVADGFLRLRPGASSGEFCAEAVEMPPFTNLVAWWNAVTPAGTAVEVLARVRIDGRYTDFLSWGRWSTGVGRASADTDCPKAYVDTDVLTVKNGKSADAVELTIRLFGDGEHTPLVFGLGATWRGQEGFLAESADAAREVHLVSPVYSQMIREPGMAHVMCSAVTAATLLNDRGLDLLPEQLALVNYDEKYKGFGNWAFTMAAASAFGYRTKLLYGGLDLLRRELDAGRSVGVNVTYSASPEGKYPYIENAATENTGGHLMTITGYGTDHGVAYFDVHDSAAVGDENCVRRYRADQLDRARTKGIAYIVEGAYEWAAPFLPGETACELKAAGAEGVYQLTEAGEPVLLPGDFYETRLTKAGGGVIACCMEGEEAPLPVGVRRTRANRAFYYNTEVTPEGFLRPNAALLKRARAAGQKLLFYIMDNAGNMRTAEL